MIEGAKEVSGYSGKSDEHRGEEHVIKSVLFGAAGEACAVFLEQLFVRGFPGLFDYMVVIQNVFSRSWRSWSSVAVSSSDLNHVPTQTGLEPQLGTNWDVSNTMRPHYGQINGFHCD